MGKMTIDDNESCSSPNESYVTENATRDSDEDDEVVNFRKVSKKRTGRAILDDSDEETQENPSETTQIPEITVEKVPSRSDANDSSNDPSDPIPFSINKFLQESDLFDAEGSDEETPNCKQENDANLNTKQKKTVKKNIKTKQSIRKEKEDVLNIHSETQRIIRQSAVSIPYHKPEQKTLQYFLNRKTHIPTEIKPCPLLFDQNTTKIKPFLVHLDQNTTEIEPPSTENDIRMDSDDDLPDVFATIAKPTTQNEAQSAKIEEITTIEPIKDPEELENTLPVRATTPDVPKPVKSSGLTPTLATLRLLKATASTPRLSTTPLDLDCDYSGQEEFFQRFADHTLQLSKTKTAKEEKRERDAKKVVKFSETPGAQLLGLKEQLRMKMAEKREMERRRRIELHEMDNEEGFGSEGENEAEVEEEEEAELTDQTDTDEEEEEEDEEDFVSLREKKTRRNIFIDDEAEDEEEDADDEEEMEENDDLEEGNCDISISGLEESKTHMQVQIFEETENNSLDTSNISADNNYGMGHLFTPGQRYTRNLFTQTTPEIERALFSPETLKSRKLNQIPTLEEEAALKSIMSIPMNSQSQYPNSQMCYNLNLSLTQTADSQIQEKSEEVGMDDLIGLCSGQFGSPKSPRKNVRKLIDPETKSQNFAKLIELCSGEFGSPVPNVENDAFVDERKRTGDETGDEMEDFQRENNEMVDFRCTNDEFIDSRGKNAEISDERKRKRDEMDDFHLSDDGNVDFKRKNDENEAEEDETDELFPQNSTRKRKIVFESSESEAESSESEDKDAIYDENEEIVTETVTRKRKIAEFFEKEAELSGSDASSDEEDMSEDDVLQEELGDMDECLPNQDALRDQVGRAHFKAMDDEDAREIRLLKEWYLEDGDLHTDGKGREKKFRWRDIYNGIQDGTETNLSGEENGDDEDEREELRKKMEKLDKEKWRQEKAKEGEIEEPEVEFFNVRTKTHSMEVSVAEKAPVPFNFLSPKSPSKLLKFRRGSFFSKAQSNPNKANDKTKPSETNAMGVKNSRKFVFIAVSPPKEPVREVPEVSSVRKRPKLERKNLAERFSHQEKSVFKFL